MNDNVITFIADIPQATFIHETNAGFTVPLACSIVTEEAEVAPVNDVVKYSVNTFCAGQQVLPFFGT